MNKHSILVVGVFVVLSGLLFSCGSAEGPSDKVITPAIPPDPADVASAVDRSCFEDFADSVAFIYQGDQALQRGVEPGAIEAHRVGVIRGRVLDGAGEPLAGVRIRVLGHPSLGETASRQDGAFDIAVNGGGALFVRFEREGLLPVTRKIHVPWRDYRWLHTVRMVPASGHATTLTTGSEVSQVARGSVESDESGSRQATVLLMPQTTAEVEEEGGSRRRLSTLSVRATEFTVGDSGPARMPGDLPAGVAYTYAVDLSADEAWEGSPGIHFDRPVFVYVDNFLDFPVGTAVPVGYLDPESGQWIPSDSGRVITVLGHSDGRAEVDCDGDGDADDARQLDSLGFTTDELTRLASLYDAGTSLWRFGVRHFSTYDCNWGFVPPEDAIYPYLDPQQSGEDDPCESVGSRIDCHNQVLGEDIPVTGLPFGLHYASDRVPGHRASYSLEVPLRGREVPASLLGIELGIEIAGQRFVQSFPADPDPSRDDDTHVFTWDGKDGYGRLLQGAHPVAVDIGYTYPGVYTDTPRFGDSGGPVTGNQTRREVTLWKEWRGSLGAYDQRAAGLGGWSLSVHHAYDPVGEILYLGDGHRRSADSMALVIERAAGNDGNNDLPFEDGMDATGPYVHNTIDAAVGPDGSLYFDAAPSSFYRVTPDGKIYAIGGDGGDSEIEGLPFSDVDIHAPEGIDVGPDGTLYIAERGYNRVRKVTPDGLVRTVAGQQSDDGGFAGDGGPAVEALLRDPYDVAISPDGQLYILDAGNFVVRRVGPDGIIQTVAGTPGVSGTDPEGNGDGGPASRAVLADPTRIALGPDGSLFIADPAARCIRRVGPSGLITTVAGTGEAGYEGDGGPATDALLACPESVAVGRDGSVYIGDDCNGTVRRVTPAGIIETFAGDPDAPDNCYGCPAWQADLSGLNGLAVGPDGALYLAEGNGKVVSRIRSPMAHFVGADEIPVPSRDGREVYVFSRTGRHLRTVHALTGGLLYGFAYDPEGRLQGITDRSGNVTTIERDSAGNPAAIVPPFGPHTTLAVDADGYLERIQDPTGSAYRFDYGQEGLLEGMTTPNGRQYGFEYDDQGRLTKDRDPAGGSKTLERSQEGIPGGYRVEVTTALGRMTTYQSQNLPNGDTQRTNTFPSGATNESIKGSDGLTTTAFADGTVVETRQAPDPRWEMHAPYVESQTVSVPSGLTMRRETSRSVAPQDPANTMSIESLQETTTIEGQTYTTRYDAALRERTTETPEGRQRTTWLDEKGRVARHQVEGRAPVELFYDAHGRLESIAEGTGADSRFYQVSYDADGRVATITDPMLRTVSFDHDQAGRITRQVLPDGREVRTTYDQNGNVTSITPPGRPPHGFSYTPVDLQQDYVPPDVGAGANLTRYEYNLDRQLELVTRPDGQTIDLRYDAAGRLDSIEIPRGTVGMRYDPVTGQLASIADPDRGTIAYAWDGMLLTGTTWEGPVNGTVERTYDTQFRLDTMTVNCSYDIDFAYDDDSLLTGAGDLSLGRDPATGLVTGTTLGDVTTSRSYNGFGELSSHTASYTGTPIFEQSFVRDDLGRIVQKTETVVGATTIYDYVYDTAGRLHEVLEDGVKVSTYDYDPNSNRAAYTDRSGTVTTGTYDDQDRMLAYGDAAYTYTENGELVTRTAGSETISYTYDVLGNLTDVDLPDGTRIHYIIDGRNRRIGKEVNGTLVQGFLYQDQLNPVAELDSTGEVVSLFVYGSRINAPAYIHSKKANGVDWATYRVIADHLGSPRLIVDQATGDIVQKISYDEFGRVLTDTNPGFQPFGFAGGIYEPATGLVRFGARDYDAVTGRWTVKDPILFEGDGTNLYGYVVNNPVIFIDPYGLKRPWLYEDCENWYKEELETELCKKIPSIGKPLAKERQKVCEDLLDNWWQINQNTQKPMNPLEQWFYNNYTSKEEGFKKGKNSKKDLFDDYYSWQKARAVKNGAKGVL